MTSATPRDPLIPRLQPMSNRERHPFVKSPTLLVEAVLPDMKAQRWGRVIQIGSDIFERALPGHSAYVAAKGAQHGLTRVWARELGQFNITVNLVAPWLDPGRAPRRRA